jgi:hypothetical protein
MGEVANNLNLVELADHIIEGAVVHEREMSPE